MILILFCLLIFTRVVLSKEVSQKEFVNLKRESIKKQTDKIKETLVIVSIFNFQDENKEKYKNIKRGTPKMTIVLLV